MSKSWIGARRRGAGSTLGGVYGVIDELVQEDCNHLISYVGPRRRVRYVDSSPSTFAGAISDIILVGPPVGCEGGVVERPDLVLPGCGLVASLAVAFALRGAGATAQRHVAVLDSGRGLSSCLRSCGAQALCAQPLVDVKAQFPIPYFHLLAEEGVVAGICACTAGACVIPGVWGDLCHMLQFSEVRASVGAALGLFARAVCVFGEKADARPTTAVNLLGARSDTIRGSRTIRLGQGATTSLRKLAAARRCHDAAKVGAFDGVRNELAPACKARGSARALAGEGSAANTLAVSAAANSIAAFISGLPPQLLRLLLHLLELAQKLLLLTRLASLLPQRLYGRAPLSQLRPQLLEVRLPGLQLLMRHLRLGIIRQHLASCLTLGGPDRGLSRCAGTGGQGRAHHGLRDLPLHLLVHVQPQGLVEELVHLALFLLDLHEAPDTLVDQILLLVIQPLRRFLLLLQDH
mmetsp:Transcript_73490/g.162571  ORF Transcript_73490/g.162571 Transcript_73490/m.162571 type:complete len:463 (+) Transcript_73490:137-1525(+)